MSRLAFFVPGIPRSQGNLKPFTFTDKRSGKVRAAMTEGTKGIGEWRRSLSLSAHQAIQEQQFTGLFEKQPLVLLADFVFPRPISLPKKIHHMTSMPDVSKLIRAVEDSLQGIAFRNDSQIVEVNARKRYMQPGEEPGVMVVLYDQTEEPL